MPMVTVNVWYHVGSAREKPGRTGFAHLFEHLMFRARGTCKTGEFDTLLEAAGGDQQRLDRERPHQLLHRRAVERARARAVPRVGSHGLPARHDVAEDASTRQRDVVKNERRQSYENAPYGMASIEIDEMLYPEGHPYHWPTIGYMEDLTAASYEDVVDVLQEVLRAGERQPGRRRRHRPGADARAGREVVRRREAGRGAGDADRLSRARC